MTEATAPGATRLLDAAARAADALVAGAIVRSARATWLAPTLEPVAGGRYRVVERTGDPTLYDGAAGIALACSAVAEVLARPDLEELSVLAARAAVDGVHRVPETGLYDGRAGIGLAALRVGLRCQDVDLARAAAQVLDDVTRATATADDVITGLAGAVLALLRGFVATGRERWLVAALDGADALVARAQRTPWGWAWRQDGEHPPLCGMAHGASGVALALAEAGRVSGQPERYREAVGEALRYERSWFDPLAGGWPDLREWRSRGEEPPRPALWCHGAAGIGLARLAVNRSLPSPAVRAEAVYALQAAVAAAADRVVAGAVPAGLTVCHGLGGVLDLLVEAHRDFGEDEHRARGVDIAERALLLLGDDVDRWPGGVQEQPGPGLMNGLAGTMLVLARLSAPREVASVGLLLM